MDGTSAGALTVFASNTAGVSYTVAVQGVPEPGAIALFAGMGFGGFGLLARRRLCSRTA